METYFNNVTKKSAKCNVNALPRSKGKRETYFKTANSLAVQLIT